MGNKNEANDKFSIGDLQEEEKHKESDLGDVKKTQLHFDPEVVQIKAGKAEIDRRISAFIERKQAEINENNVREFCNVIDCNQENSCARTDAIFTPYPGFKSHVKVSRVVNTYGPQTRPEGIPGSGHKPNSMLRDCGNQAVEERLQNIEAHLRLQTGGPVPRDIYQRIKKLEDKILELEGISPEYFQSVSFSGKEEKFNHLNRTIHWLNLMRKLVPSNKPSSENQEKQNPWQPTTFHEKLPSILVILLFVYICVTYTVINSTDIYLSM